MPDLIEGFKLLLPYLDVIAKGAGTLAFLAIAFFGIKVLTAIPLSVRVQAGEEIIDYAGFFKGVVYTILAGVALAHCALLWIQPLLMVAKIMFLEMLAIGIITSWICIANSGRWCRDLTTIQAECELATNLTFLQGEMVRAQLEELNDRIHRKLEPEEVDAAQALLKALSPAVMLFVQKEKSIVKWGMAAANVGKTLTNFFNSPKKSAQ